MNDEYLRNRPLTEVGQLHLSVGIGQGDLQGQDDKVLQAGLDYLQRLGGGVLNVGPGIYTMNNALYLQPNVKLKGVGEETVFKKAPSFCTNLILDSDWYEAKVRVEDASGFQPGCGIMLRAYQGERLSNVVQATVTAVDDNVVSLDRRLLKNFWIGDRATAATVFPILTAKAGVCGVEIEDVVLDGNRDNNEEINGNYSGAMFIQECDRFTLRRVTAQNYHGDGFSFQVCDDVHFEHCKALNNANLGFHPGSGSQRPIFDHCVAKGNSLGIFFCWGVSDGLASHCVCSENLKFGISIGHRDTDNRIENTLIERNGEVGILFRDPVTDFRGGHRNDIVDCTIRDNGDVGKGVGVDIRGLTCDVTIRNTAIEDTGKGNQVIGVRMSPEAQSTTLIDNTFLGIKTDIEDLSVVAAD